MPVRLNTIIELCGHFLEPFKHLLSDEEVTDIWRNGDGSVFYQSGGRKRSASARIDEDMLVVAVRSIGRMVSHAEMDRSQPILDARLPDGSRINAVLFPISQPGSTLSIRKFRMKHFSLDRLVEMGSVSRIAADLLRNAVTSRESILIAGATGSGKTTLANALANLIDSDERLCIVEDTSELQVAVPNVVRMEARQEQDGVRAVTLRELMRCTLRQKPDRIILGEVRDGAAFELVTAMSTGHDGTISTIHANSAVEALDRLVTCCQMTPERLDRDVIQRLVGRSLKWVVFMDRNRRLNEILRVTGHDAGGFTTEQAYLRRELAVATV